MIINSLRKFGEGDAVYIEYFSHAKPKWISGTIQKPTGPVSYSVNLSDGNIVKRHVDNIKARYSASTNPTNGSEFDLAFQSGPEPTEDTQHSVTSDCPSTSNETTESTKSQVQDHRELEDLQLDTMKLLLYTDEASELGEEEM